MINIIPDLENSLSLKLNPTFKECIKETEHLTVGYGIRKVSVSVSFSDSINDNQLLLSVSVIESLNIPTTSPYEISFSEGKIIIGPFIGILTAVTNEQLNQFAPNLSSYVKHYDQIGGTIVAFSLEGVNQEKKTINGLIYKPNEKQWVQGSFSYPSSILSIVETSLTKSWDYYQQTMNHFHEILGPRIFNFPNFDKWIMYQMLKQNMDDYLPKTKLYTQPNDVINMLKLYQSIYIKPLNGRLGKYVFKLSRNSQGISVNYGGRKKRVKIFTSRRSLNKFLTYKLRNGYYLIQQSIELFTYDNRIIDFRIMMVKNELGKWENIGTIARYGSTNSIVSNVTAGGKAEYGVKTLQTVFQLSAKEIKRLLFNVNAIVLNALSVVEAHGYHCGNIGFDIGIDKKGDIWIIEMNNQNPDHYIAVKAKKKGLYYKAKLKNILYAKKLGMNSK